MPKPVEDCKSGRKKLFLTLFHRDRPSHFVPKFSSLVCALMRKFYSSEVLVRRIILLLSVLILKLKLGLKHPLQLPQSKLWFVLDSLLPKCCFININCKISYHLCFKQEQTTIFWWLKQVKYVWFAWRWQNSYPWHQRFHKKIENHKYIKTDKKLSSYTKMNDHLGQKSPSLVVFKRQIYMQHLGTQFSGWVGTAGPMVGLNDLRCLFQPK